MALELELFLPALCSIGAASAAHNPSLLSLPDSMGPTFGVPGEMGGRAPHSAMQNAQLGWKNSWLGTRAVGKAALAEQPWEGCPECRFLGQPELGKATKRSPPYWVLHTPTPFHRPVGSLPTSCPAGWLLPTPTSDLRGNTKVPALALAHCL